MVVNNMTKKVLIITTRPLESNESASIRKINTIKSLLDAGVDVTILTTRIPKNTPYYNIDTSSIKMAKRVELETGSFYNFGVTKNGNNTNIIRQLKLAVRTMYYKFIVYDPLKRCLKFVNTLQGKIENKYDIIISMSDPKSSHLLALELLKKGFVKCNLYIQIWGDPMYLDITNKTLIPKPIIKIKEKKLLERPDKIFYVSPLTLEAEKKLFPEYADKMDVLFPTYQHEYIYEPVTEIKKIGYFGDYYSDVRNIIPLYNAIKNSNYKLTICGYSDLDLKPTDNILIYGRVPLEQVKKFEKEVDLLVHISNRFGTQIPGKIYQYMGTNKPILFILENNKNLIMKIFQPFNRVMFCENNEKDILKTIEMFNAGNFNLNIKPVAEFNNGIIAKKILNQSLNVNRHYS